MAVLHRGRLHAFGTPHALAAELWEGLEADLELGGSADPATLDLLASLDGVLTTTATPTGARIRVARPRRAARVS